MSYCFIVRLKNDVKIIDNTVTALLMITEVKNWISYITVY